MMPKIVNAGFKAKTKAWTFEVKSKAITVGLEEPQSLA